ncbi:MAG: hypothetical protein HS126_19155 [Anaerolineales bacterium]|nr:hypothetical protein [Anaerolineales bacterium]
MPSRLRKGLVGLIKFYHRIYINLWLRRRGYRPVPAVEYVRLMDESCRQKKNPD